MAIADFALAISPKGPNMSGKKLIKSPFALILFFTLVNCPNLAISAADNFAWPQGKRVAVSLTFDDARDSQLDVGIPILNSYGVKGTFYIHPQLIEQRLSAWKDAINAGHEIGNHSIYHPCSGNHPLPNERNALEYYTLERMASELNDSNIAIERILGVRPTSFAYPCGETFVGRGQNVQSYIPLIAQRFQTGRTYNADRVANKPDFCDLAQVRGIKIDGLSVDQIKALVDEAAKNGSWLVMVGHTIGDYSGYHVTQTKTLAAFCKYANEPQNEIWIATVAEIATYINSHRKLETNNLSVMFRKLPNSSAKLLAVSVLTYILAIVIYIKTSALTSKLILLTGSVILLISAIWSMRLGYLSINGLIPIFAVVGLCIGYLSAILWSAKHQKI